MMLQILPLLLGAMQAAPAAPEPIVRREKITASLDIPDEIAPAVLPYMGCLLARDGVDVRGSFDPRPKDVAKGGDCSRHRVKAARDADALLRRIGGRSARKRAAFIEATLSAMDRFQNPGGAPQAPEKRPDAPN